MSTIIHETNTEGFHCVWSQDADGRVFSSKADGDIDADGSNSQNGKQAAYMKDDKGSEFLANGGMGMRNGEVVFIADWGKDIVLTQNGRPLVLSSGVVPSLTAWKDPALAHNDPWAYADAESVPYMAIPGPVRLKAKGTVLGCRGKITDIRTGKSVEVGVLDIGPRTKSGEFSIAAARELDIPSSPRHGGEEKAVLLYEFWPNEPFVFGGFTYALIRA